MRPNRAARAALLVVVVLYLSAGPVPHASAQGGPIDLGANTEYVGPHLWAMLQRHADGEVVPDLVVVEIGHRTDLEVDPPLEEFIRSVGGEEVAKNTWRIPTENALSVIQRPDLVYMARPAEATEGEADPYPTMDGTLNDIVAAYAGGITGANAVRYALFIREESVALAMKAPDAATVKRIRSWLTRRSVHVPPERDFTAFSDDFLSALVPVSRLTGLVAAFPSTYLSVSTHAGQGLPLDRAQWPAETREFEEKVVAQFLPPQPGEATPAPMPTPTPTVTPAPVSPALTVKYDSDGDGLIEVSNLEQLDAIRYDLDGDGIPEGATQDEYAAAYPLSGEEVVCHNNCNGYELARPLDFAAADSYASGAVNGAWTTGDEWWPIGDGWRPFAATFNGNGHAVSNLHITPTTQADGSSVDGFGLFGSVGVSGVIRETGLLNANVAGGDFVGPLAGASQGTVSHSYATGSVSGCVGGLVGSNDFGVISSSYATGSISGGRKYLGGLAGCNNGGTIIASYATGSVSGDIEVGGLAGNNRGSVVASYATGSVRGQKYVGGLVGNNDDGSINASYSVSEVTGGHYIGGLAGGNGGMVGYSYAVGKVSSDGSIDAPLRYIGGLVGYNPGIISSGLWDTETSGQEVGIGIEIGDGQSSDLFGKTTAELQSPAGYTGPYQGWDVYLSIEGAESTPDYSLSDFLDFGTSGQYPALKVDFDGDGTATWQEFGGQGRTAPTVEPVPHATPPVEDNCVEIMTTAVVRGDWSSDCLSFNRPGSYARFHVFTLDTDSAVFITLESDDTNTYLYLQKGAGGTGEYFRSQGSPDRYSRIEDGLAAGTYTIESTTYDAGQAGSFTLTVNGLATPPPPPPHTPVPTTTLLPTPTPTRVPTSIPTPTFMPTSTPALVKPTNTPAPTATAIAAQEPASAPESGGACSYPDADTPTGAAAISMFLLATPLATIGGLKFRARRRWDR